MFASADNMPHGSTPTGALQKLHIWFSTGVNIATRCH